MNSSRLLLASIHDVSPVSKAKSTACWTSWDRTVGNRVAMLVVPNHWGDAPIIPGSAFASAAAKLGRQGNRDVPSRLLPPRHECSRRKGGSAAGPLHDGRRGRVPRPFKGRGCQAHCRRTRPRGERDRPLDRRLRCSGMALWSGRRWKPSMMRRCPCRRPFASLVAGVRQAARTWSRHHLGKPDADAPRIIARCGCRSSRHAPLEVLRIGVHPPDVRHPALVAKHRGDLSKARLSRSAAALWRPSRRLGFHNATETGAIAAGPSNEQVSAGAMSRI